MFIVSKLVVYKTCSPVMFQLRVRTGDVSFSSESNVGKASRCRIQAPTSFRPSEFNSYKSKCLASKPYKNCIAS